MIPDKTVDRESLQKLYVQMYSILKEKIERREWPHGSQIPTEDELCRAYAVSKATVRMAIMELVRIGCLRKQQGRGTFVTYAPQDLGVTMKTKLTEDMFGEGVNATKEMLEKSVIEAPEEMPLVLSAPGSGNAAVCYILCKRMVNGETAYIEESYVPLAVLPAVDQEEVCKKPLYELIQQKGTKKIFKVLQTIEVTQAGKEAAALLQVAEGAPALLLHRLLIGPDLKPVAYTRLLGPGTKYKILTEFERIK